MTTTNMRVPGALTQADTVARCPVGTPWTDESNWKRYCYVTNEGATSWTIGVPVGILLTATKWGECSFTAATQLLMTEAATAMTVVAGVALGTVAEDEFGWIQVGGFCAYVVTDGNVDASEALVVADNGVAAVPAGETTQHGIFGTCITADGATTVSTGVLLTRCALDHH